MLLHSHEPSGRLFVGLKTEINGCRLRKQLGIDCRRQAIQLAHQHFPQPNFSDCPEGLLWVVCFTGKEADGSPGTVLGTRLQNPPPVLAITADPESCCAAADNQSHPLTWTKIGHGSIFIGPDVRIERLDQCAKSKYGAGLPVLSKLNPFQWHASLIEQHESSAWRGLLDLKDHFVNSVPTDGKRGLRNSRCFVSRELNAAFCVALQAGTCGKRFLPGELSGPGAIQNNAVLKERFDRCRTSIDNRQIAHLNVRRSFDKNGLHGTFQRH